MEEEIVPQARPRSRTGMLPLDWSRAPTQDDLWPDKVNVELRGHVRWPDGVSFHAYLLDITQDRAFADRPTVGRKYRSSIHFGSIMGDVTISMGPGARADEPVRGTAGIKLSLFLNPTRTRAHAVRRNNAPLEELTLRQFFNPLPPINEAFNERREYDDCDALDGNDNFFWNAHEAGGSSPEQRARARDAFLMLFEVRLRKWVEGLFSPSPTAPGFDDTLGEHRPNVSLSIEWGELRITHAEIYAERLTKEPSDIMLRLYGRGLTLARSIRASKFTGEPTKFVYATHEGFAQAVVPLTGRGNFALSVYAKTPRRIRFEVIYRREFSGIIRGASSAGQRLVAPLAQLMRDAAKRMPWDALRQAVQVRAAASPSDVIDFMVFVQAASRGYPELFQPVVKSLILTGGVRCDHKQNPGLDIVIDGLVRSGVLERWKVQQKESRDGRQYGLTPKYFAAWTRIVAACAPVEDPFEAPVARPPICAPESWQPVKTTTIKLHARNTSHRQREILRREGLSG